MTRIILIVAMLLGVLPIHGCEDGKNGAPAGRPQGGLRTVPLRIGNRDFTAEVVDDDNKRTIGMMYRDSVGPNAAMLFIFRNSEVRSFYMRNTRIALDILYLDDDAKVVNIRTMLPYDLRSVSSEVPCKYAIEVGGGVAKQIGAKIGDVIDLPANARSTDK